MEKLYYDYNSFIKDLKDLYLQVKDCQFDTILSIARGGLTIGHFLSEKMNIRKSYTINSIHYNDTKKLDTINILNIPNLNDSKKVLIVDDIIDSGDTIQAILKELKFKYPNIDFQILSIFYKKTATIQPNFTIREATKWIDFFWSEDLK